MPRSVINREISERRIVMEKYEELEIEVIEFETEDIITNSPDDGEWM